jgi:outer membrane protein OmpA-like peptidoglycan-associated protein
MKIITIGLIVFIIWSAFSTYFYVCKIRGLCFEPVAGIIAPDGAERYAEIVAPVKKAIPENLITYFEFDKSDFSTNPIVDSLITKFKTFLNLSQNNFMIITGHTDATGSEAYNIDLGYRRAKSMEDFCESMGIANHQIILESKGESDPIEDNSTDRGRAGNRRAVITIKK